MVILLKHTKLVGYGTMKFSTKAEYGLKAIVNLAQAYPRQKSIKTLSDEESVSVKYLERLMGTLRKKGLVNSEKGSSGGYTLARLPQDIPVGEIIEALDGPIAPMKCSGSLCAKNCASSSIWIELENQIKKTLYSTTLKKLIKK